MVSFTSLASVGPTSLTNGLMHRFLDTVHLVLCVYMVYYYVVTEFGNEFALLTVHWSLKAGHSRFPHRGALLTPSRSTGTTNIRGWLLPNQPQCMLPGD